MVTKLIFIYALFMGVLAHAQSLGQTVLSTSGDHFQNGSAALSWTIGEPVINSLENGSVRLTQGFHQPYLTVSSVIEAENKNLVSVYPNPAIAMLSIDFASSGEYTAELFDVLGRKLNTFKIIGSHYELDLNDFPAANYLLKCYDAESKSISTFKIQKIR
jgi:hypothetical protein